VVEATIQWQDGERFVASGTSGHALIIDSDRQRNSAAGPMELVLQALCACAATDVVSILKKKRQPFTGLEVRARAKRAASPPAFFTTIHLIFRVFGRVEPKAADDAVRLSYEKYCSVAAMLRSTARITTEVQISERGTASEHKKLKPEADFEV